MNIYKLNGPDDVDDDLGQSSGGSSSAGDDSGTGSEDE